MFGGLSFAYARGSLALEQRSRPPSSSILLPPEKTPFSLTHFGIEVQLRRRNEVKARPSIRQKKRAILRKYRISRIYRLDILAL
jgi:hypothetical protein